MKTKLLIFATLLLLLLNTPNAHAQLPRAFASFGIGLATPRGSFGDYEPISVGGYNPVSGMGAAMPGLAAEAAFGYRFSSLVGAMVMARGFSFPADERALEVALSDAYRQNITADSRNWKSAACLVGPFLAYPIVEEKLTVEGKALVGVAGTASPETTFQVNGEQSVMKSDQEYSGAFLLGAGLKFHPTSKIAVGLHYDIFSASPTFSEAGGSISKVRVQAVCTTLSVGYYFW